MRTRLSPPAVAALAASILLGLAGTLLATPSVAQRAPKTDSGPKNDSGPRYAYPATGTSAAARALAGKPVPVWPVPGPAPLPGSVLPAKRIIAYYGNPFSKRMGVLGEYPKAEMLAMLDREVTAWTKADPSTPVQPALHLITTVAQGDAGKDGKYRMRHGDALTEKVYG